jgi:hypothetical protein
MRLDAGVRRQSTRVTIINGPHQPSPNVGRSLPRCRTRSTFVESGSPLAWAPYAVPLAAPCRRGPYQ